MPCVANILSSLGITAPAEDEETVSTSTEREYLSMRVNNEGLVRKGSQKSRQRHDARGKMVGVTF